MSTTSPPTAKGMDVAQAFPELPERLEADEYNFERFQAKHLVADVKQTISEAGIPAGAIAPDFERPRVGGGRLRLEDLRGRPVLLHFGSFTCPMTMGSVEPLKKLYGRWGGQVQFVDVFIRQAHPGPDVPPYRTFEEKERAAERYAREEGIAWPVVVDDVEGRVHQVYGGLADPTYLIDRDGRVAYYNMWTGVPALHQAIRTLLEQGGRGSVRGGLSRRVHLGAALTDGWRALARGLPQSFTDLMKAAPGSPALVWLGYQMRPALAPLTLRAEPLPPPVKLGVAAGAVLVAAGAVSWLVVRRRARRRAARWLPSAVADGAAGLLAALRPPADLPRRAGKLLGSVRPPTHLPERAGQLLSALRPPSDLPERAGELLGSLRPPSDLPERAGQLLSALRPPSDLPERAGALLPSWTSRGGWWHRAQKMFGQWRRPRRRAKGLLAAWR